MEESPNNNVENLSLKDKRALLEGEKISKEDIKAKVEKEYGNLNAIEKQAIFMALVGENVTETAPTEIKVETPTSESEKKENPLVFSPRKGFEPIPTIIETPVYATPEPTPEPIAEPVVEQIPEQTEKIEAMFDNLEILKHEVKEGDSLWVILNEISKNSKKFENITEAQKIFVLNKISGLIFDEPETFGLNKDGSLEIGKKIDLSKILNDAGEIEPIIKEAQETITAGSLKEKSTLKLVEQAKTTEPEIKPMPEPVIITPETRAKETQKVETMGVLEKEKREAIHQQIEEAKQRLTHLENENTNTKNSNLERSLSSDSRFVSLDSKFSKEVEAAFANEIGNIYGKSGLMGMGKTEGIKTKEWAEMARLPAGKVIEYYTGDSTKSGLSPETIKTLLKSKSHEALMRQTAGLMEQSNGAVKPFANENMEQFIKRLGGYVLRTHLQKAA